MGLLKKGKRSQGFENSSHTQVTGLWGLAVQLLRTALWESGERVM